MERAVNTAHTVDDALCTRMVERFMRYAAIPTTSDKHIEATPSTDTQWKLAKLLVEELKALGIADITLTGHCYVIARLPACGTGTGAERPVIGFLAHLDTASEVNGERVRPVIDERDGKRIIRSDGTTLLGADDKAGIAEIMTALEYLLAHPEIPRAPLEIIFSPDEETGKGLPELPLDTLRSSYCYTVDGGAEPEIETECFNAYSVKLIFTGHVIHPGAARGKLVNAVSMAAYFISLLPAQESPEATDGYYGYYCPIEVSGTQAQSCVELIVRDFERGGIERRLAALRDFARAAEAAFPGGKAHLTAQESYFNMKEKIDAAPEVLAKLKTACRNIGKEPCLKPIRGGTDGSRLTSLGIPTPNFWTGGRNWHSLQEFAVVDEMRSAAELIIELARLWAYPA